MSVQPIYNPVIPCVQPIPGGAYPGLMIRIRGSSFPNSDRFAINLQCGPNTDPRDDIALHLNVRYEHMCIVRNNLCNMNWGPEEIDGGMPIQRGQPFEALLLIELNSFKVAFNGAHFCEFPHRVPFQRITHMTIDGDVSIQTIGFEGAAPPPPQYAPPTQPGYGYGGPQPQGNFGQQPYEQPPMYAGGAQGMPMQQRSGMGTGAAVGLGVGALAAGGLAGYALGGGFSSNDSPSDEQVDVNVLCKPPPGYVTVSPNTDGYCCSAPRDHPSNLRPVREPQPGDDDNIIMKMFVSCLACVSCKQCLAYMKGYEEEEVVEEEELKHDIESCCREGICCSGKKLSSGKSEEGERDEEELQYNPAMLSSPKMPIAKPNPDVSSSGHKSVVIKESLKEVTDAVMNPPKSRSSRSNASD